MHPRTVNADTLRYTLSFGLGGMSATLVLVLFGTGLLQLLSYSPHSDSAYLSIQQMYNNGNPAGFIRNCHHWAGNLLVVIPFLHLLRVFLTGALTGPRRYNWLVGLSAFLLVLLANFTGYLMPWDQLAYWAVTIFTSMLSYIPLVGKNLMALLRGGEEVGAATLSTFYAVHVGFIPTLLLFLLVYHFWLIRKAGGLIRRAAGKVSEEKLQTIPHLLAREAATGFMLLALLFMFSAFVDAPLAEQANPGQSPNPAKAAWYFMGLQELLLHLHPVFAVCVVPSLMLGFLAVVPFRQEAILPPGVWFGGRKGRQVAAASSVAGAALVVLGVILDDMLFVGAGASQAKLLLYGVIPTVFFILVVVVHYYLLRLVWHCTKAEAMLGAVTLVLSAVTTLTVVGIWFRGPGMALVW
nr:cytochrome b N-terminal domain-containing protein [Desulfopila inferna]